MIEGIKEYRQAGKIAKQVRGYAKSIIKKGMPLIEIAEKVEAEVEKLGAKPAFPVNLSINDIAAHNSPTYDDKTLASGLLKIDFGVHVEGYIVDTAFTLDLEDNEENKKLIEAAELALQKAIKITREGIELWKLGEEIQKTITSLNFSPVRNLSGHELEKYKVHAGLTIPNTNNNNKTKLDEGVYAIEPFSTNGQGIVYEGKPSGIYSLIEKKSIRIGRDILNFIEQEYKTLPFCSRWLVNKFGSRALLVLKFLEKEKILHHYPTLVEKGKGKVAQAETSIIVTKKGVEVLTK